MLKLIIIVDHKQVQKHNRKPNFEQSQIEARHQQTSTPNKALMYKSTVSDKKIKTDLSNVPPIDSQKVRPSSADDINSKKHKLCKLKIIYTELIQKY